MDEKIASARVKHVRISPRKVKVVMDLIRGKSADSALAILQNTRKAACEPMSKLLRSAIANAENNFGMERDRLYVRSCSVDAGPTMKRMMPRARGSADTIRKRTCHMTIALAERAAGEN